MLITAAPIARLLFGVALLSLALLGVAVFVVVVFCFAWHQKQKQQRPRLVPKQHEARPGSCIEGRYMACRRR
ncbi:hypothetical protein PMIN01_10801 [Paraphaeosphaeria minitans]|uniref:Uncharacterized protein n=1 Tax=Paraphaeosphaeria minitans TaxID=565426 RepID=A0A9P6G966_9PLEO|nr:hypothetical protein PMIN01_10801 [Paraphaeosphaeria minitans]